MSAWETIKNLVLTTLGHAVSGGIVAAGYEVTLLVQAGATDWKVIGTGLLLGGCIGFLKSIVEELEKLKQDTKGFGKVKTWGRYLI